MCSASEEELNCEKDGAWLSKHLGFVGDANQINVAITRSKEGLCIIGNLAPPPVETTDFFFFCMDGPGGWKDGWIDGQIIGFTRSF